MPGVSRTAREQWPKYQMGRRGAHAHQHLSLWLGRFLENEDVENCG